MPFDSHLATAMSRLGKIEEFDAKVQTFDSYLERFEHFVSANDIAQEKKLSVFLTVIGAEAYEVLKNLVVPSLPGEKTFDEVKVLLKNHYSPPISIIAERCRFNRRVQLEHESVEDFIIEIKHLARKCDFGSFLKTLCVTGLWQESAAKTFKGLYSQKKTWALKVLAKLLLRES